MYKKLSFLTAAVLLGTSASAHQVDQTFNLAKLSEAANMVFKGTVVSIDYRGSRASKNATSLPHTFVTYEIEKVLYGMPSSSNRKTFTLRFLGGRNKKGNIMLVSTAPKFDIGDQDVLFVAKNGSTECPIVNCANGRFRIVEDLIFNEYGQQVTLSNKGNIELGKVVIDPVFTTFNVGDTVFEMERDQSVAQDDKTYLDMTTVKSQTEFNQISSNQFLTQISKTLSISTPNNPRGVGKVATNVDRNKAFTFTPAKAEAPKNIRRDIGKILSEKELLAIDKQQNYR